MCPEGHLLPVSSPQDLMRTGCSYMQKTINTVYLVRVSRIWRVIGLLSLHLSIIIQGSAHTEQKAQLKDSVHTLYRLCIHAMINPSHVHMLCSLFLIAALVHSCHLHSFLRDEDIWDEDI